MVRERKSACPRIGLQTKIRVCIDDNRSFEYFDELLCSTFMCWGHIHKKMNDFLIFLSVTFTSSFLTLTSISIGYQVHGRSEYT